VRVSWNRSFDRIAGLLHRALTLHLDNLSELLIDEDRAVRRVRLRKSETKRENTGTE
jgi:hypothetical protein